jgi:hypothetical protein
MQLTLLKAVTDNKRIGLICASTGYFSILLCAAGSRFGTEGLESFGLLFAACVIFAALTICLTLLYSLFGESSIAFSKKWIGRAAIFYTCVLLFFASILTLMTPASAWDFLSYWSLEVLRSMPNIDVITLGNVSFESQKHPWMISRFLASSLGFTEKSVTPGYFWLSLLLMHMLCLKYLVASLRLDLMWLSVAFWVFFVPLVENHFTNFGYAEAALCLGVNLFFCLFHQATKTRSPAWFFFAVLAAASLMLIKTSGSILCIICLIAAAGSFPKIYNTSHTRMLCFSCFFCIATVIASIFLSGWKLSFLKTGTMIMAPEFFIVVDIFQRAFWENVSFSLTALLSIFCFCVLAPALRYHPYASSILCLMHIFLGMATCLVLFIFTEYGVGHSLPEQDTSFSRLALPATGAVSILTLFSVHVLQADRNHSRSS